MNHNEMPHTQLTQQSPQAININIGNQYPLAAASYFDGTLTQVIGIYILAFLITALTLGICFPWGVMRIYRWEAEHTVINGRRLRFNGTATGLFGLWIKWILLLFVTLGLYSFWIRINLLKWKAKHTFFA